MAEGVPLSSPPPLFPLLPDEISVLCLARVTVTSHTAISQVSRSWRSFVRSSSFFALRSQIAVTELVLTVSIVDSESRNRWYHLHPYQTPFPLPPPQETKFEYLGCASLAPHLFCIGATSSFESIKIYDGCLRRWSYGPPTYAPRGFVTAGVAGGRIHLIDHNNVSPLAESLDPTGTRWDPVPPIPAHLVGNWQQMDTTIIDGELLVRGISDGQLIAVAFDPDAPEWTHAPPWSMEDVPLYCMAVVGGVPYMFRNPRDGIEGYGSDGQWRSVEGESVAELINRMNIYYVRLLTFGSLLCLEGEEREPGDGLVVRIFAGIKISRTADGGFRGSIMWLDTSLKHSKAECFHQCLALEL